MIAEHFINLLADYKGQFRIYCDGRIRHKTIKSNDGCPLCFLAMVVTGKIFSNGELEYFIGLPMEEINKIVQVSDKLITNLNDLELVVKRVHLLETLGLKEIYS